MFLWTFNGKTVQKANKPSDPTGMAVSEDGNVILTVLNDHFIKVITKLPNSEQSYKRKVQTHNYINRQNQSTTGKL